MPTTTNYSWTTPADTDLVKDGASAIRTLGSAVDTTVKNLNPETTLGDISYRSSTANVKTRLALGTANQVLRVNSGATAPEWATLQSGGMTELTAAGSPLTLSGASVSFTSIPTTYKNLQLWIYNWKPATDDTQLIYRINSDSGANYLSDSRMNGSNVNPNGTFNYLSLGQDNSTANGAIIVNFYDYATTTTATIQDVRGFTNNATTSTNLNLWASWNIYRTTGAATTTITLSALSGNLTSGTARLFGVS